MALPSKISSAGELKPPMVTHRTDADRGAERGRRAAVPSQIRPKWRAFPVRAR